MNKINNLIIEMFDFDEGAPELIQHFIKVHEFAKLIGDMEEITSNVMEILEVAAIVHDIGIKVSMKKYGKCNGKLQEQEGPSYAEKLLNRLEFNKEVIERVKIGRAHV